MSWSAADSERLQQWPQVLGAASGGDRFAGFLIHAAMMPTHRPAAQSSVLQPPCACRSDSESPGPHVFVTEAFSLAKVRGKRSSTEGVRWSRREIPQSPLTYAQINGDRRVLPIARPGAPFALVRARVDRAARAGTARHIASRRAGARVEDAIGLDSEARACRGRSAVTGARTTVRASASASARARTGAASGLDQACRFDRTCSATIIAGRSGKRCIARVRAGTAHRAGAAHRGGFNAARGAGPSPTGTPNGRGRSRARSGRKVWR